MLSVIKTAIITIIISFISGVLLDTYKNYAPRILCIMGKGIPIQLNGRRIKAYNLTVKNISSKTLHDLNICVQGYDNNMKMDEARITGGLKFDVSKENSMINVSIPFLSKDDVFNVKLFMENIQGVNKKPAVTLRSPENFKRIGKGEKKGFLGSLLSIPEGVENLFESNDTRSNSRRSENYGRERDYSHNAFLNKKALIAVCSLVLVLCLGWIGIEHYNDVAEKSQATQANTSVKQSGSTSSSASLSGSTGSTNAKSTDSSKSDNSSTKSSEDKSDGSQNESGKSSSSSVKDTKSESTEITNNTKTSNNSKVTEDKNKESEKTTEDKSSQDTDNNAVKEQPAATASTAQDTEQNTEQKPSTQSSNVNKQTGPTAVPSSAPSVNSPSQSENTSPSESK